MLLTLARVLALSLAIPAALVRAQPLEGQAEAQRLFDQARAELAAGSFAEACPKLEQSQRLDPQLGTSLHLAHCYEKTGRLEDAWNQFQGAQLMAAERRLRGQPDPREALAQRRAAAIEPRVSLVTLVVAEPAPAGLSVEHDGQSLPRERWGRAFAVPPGSHRVLVRAPSKLPWEQTYTLDPQAQPLRIELPPLAAAASVAESQPPRSHEAPKRVIAATPSADEGLGPQRIAAYALGGAGLVAAGIATGFYLTAKAASDEQDPVWSACRRSRESCDYMRNAELEQQVQTNAESARIALAISGALVAGALVLWLTEPEREVRPSLALSVEPGAMQVWLRSPEF